MRKEEELRKRFGRENPFSVPENYFDGFAGKMQELVSKEPVAPHTAAQEDRRTLFVRMKPYLYLAALFAGLYFSINVVKYRQSIADKPKAESVAAANNANSEDAYIDEVCEYAGIDKDHIYAYATGQDYGY